MKNLTFVCLWVLGISVLPAQTLYKWRLQVGPSLFMYKGDVGAKKMISGKPTAGLHVALERRFAYGIAAQVGVNTGTITANDRLSVAGKLDNNAPNFDRSLNFRTRFTAAYLKLVYYTNNGYLLKEDARVAPFLFAGVGANIFNVYVDQFYGPSSQYMYNYADLDGNVREEGGAYNAKLQDGVYETNVTKRNLEDKSRKNSSLIIPFGMGVNVRFSDRWSSQIAASMILPTSDFMDGVSGQANPNLDPLSTEAYLANPSGYAGNRKQGTKKDKLYSASIGVGYHFGGNYYDKGPVVQAPLKDTTKIKKKKDAYVLDPFEQRDLAAAKPKNKKFTLREKEEMVLFTNASGKKDTMYVMKMDTLYYDYGYNAYSDVSTYSTKRGDNGTPTPSRTNRGEGYTSYDSMNPAKASAVDANTITDIYEQLAKLNTGMQAMDARVRQIENTLATGSLKTTTTAGNVGGASNANTESSAAVFDNLQQVLVYFPYGSAVLDAAAYKSLDAVADILKQHAQVGVALNAFADPSGTAATNMRLSQERAAAARKYLVSKGAKGYQVIAQYHGEEEVAGKPDPKKRRVEIEFIKVR